MSGPQFDLSFDFIMCIYRTTVCSTQHRHTTKILLLSVDSHAADVSSSGIRAAAYLSKYQTYSLELLVRYLIFTKFYYRVGSGRGSNDYIRFYQDSHSNDRSKF